MSFDQGIMNLPIDASMEISARAKSMKKESRVGKSVHRNGALKQKCPSHSDDNAKEKMKEKVLDDTKTQNAIVAVQKGQIETNQRKQNIVQRKVRETMNEEKWVYSDVFRWREDDLTKSNALEPQKCEFPALALRDYSVTDASDISDLESARRDYSEEEQIVQRKLGKSVKSNDQLQLKDTKDLSSKCDPDVKDDATLCPEDHVNEPEENCNETSMYTDYMKQLANYFFKDTDGSTMVAEGGDAILMVKSQSELSKTPSDRECNEKQGEHANDSANPEAFDALPDTSPPHTSPEALVNKH